MTLAFVVSAFVLAVAAALRAGGASLVRTQRADALHAAAEGDHRAARVAELLEQPIRLQPSIAMVHSALLVAAAVPATWAVSGRMGGWPLAGGLVALSLALVVFGDLLPRAMGRSRPGHLAYRLSALLVPAVRWGGRATDLIVMEEEAEEPEGAQDGDETEQDREERELISSVLEFSDTLVREVMVPRTDMVSVARDASTDEALDLVIEHGYSRIPVTGEGADDVIGIAYAKDLLRLMDEGTGPVPVTGIMRTPDFIPETKRVSDLLREMQAGKVHLAIVVDEFGGTAGLVTIEDLIEEIVGEIVDEYDTEAPLVVEEGEGVYLVDGRLPVEELSGLIGVELPDDEWDTVGGLMLGLAGRLPREGETFEYDATQLTALRVQGRRVAQVRVLCASPGGGALASSGNIG